MLHAQGYITENPSVVLKRRRERNRRVRVLQPTEYEAFFSALAQAPEWVQLLVLLLTAMRLGEALTAKWEYVSFERREIHLPDSKSGRPRVIPLSCLARTVCEELQRRRINEYLFPGRHGGHMTRPGRHINALMEAAGTSGLTLHDLRRSWASLAAQHVQMPAVARFLGHSNVLVTERYVVTRDDQLHAAAAWVDRHFQNALAQPTVPQLLPTPASED